MKSLSFSKCLDQALQILTNSRGGTLYVSIGCFLKKNVSVEKVQFQQALMLDTKKPIVVILVDPMFVEHDPLYLDRLEQYHVQEFGKKVVVAPNMTFFKCGEFLHENALSKLIRSIQQNPLWQFYIGDFTVSGYPFHEFPVFYKKVICLPNVWLSQSNHFVNAMQKCDHMP